MINGIQKMNLEEGRKYVKERLQGDYAGLSEKTQMAYKEQYEAMMKTVFVD